MSTTETKLTASELIPPPFDDLNGKVLMDWSWVDRACRELLASLEAKGAWEQQTLNDLWHHFFRLGDAKACSQVFCYAKDKGLHVGPAPSTRTPDPWPDNDADRGDRILELEAELASLQPVTETPEQREPAYLMRHRIAGYETPERETKCDPCEYGRDAAEGERPYMPCDPRRAPNVSPHEQERITDGVLATDSGAGDTAGVLGVANQDNRQVGRPSPADVTPTDRETISELVKNLNEHNFLCWSEAMEIAAAALTRLIDERDAREEFYSEQATILASAETEISALQSQLAAAKEELEVLRRDVLRYERG